MNSMQVKDKIRNISKNKNVDFNSVFRLYMYDRFIERLAVSKYKNNFILKGGFYLSIIFGVENRTTMDIDTAIKNTTFNEDNIITIINEIINVDINDNSKLELVSLSPIRQEDEYGGYRATINAKFENINIEHYRKAVENTFSKRKYNGNISETIKIIKQSEILKTRWNSYSKKYRYAQDITYEEIMECLEKIVETLQLSVV